ncbi:MAG: ABC transporter substrate binding protein [Pseudomonadota bacterium]
MWEFYCEHLKSDYLEFVPDGFYTAGWDPEKRKEISRELILRLNGKKDLDLVIAMGTWAGIDLSQGNHTTPTIVLAVSDAVASGIIKSIDNSGNDYIHARVDSDRYERQVHIFHTIIGFKTLGMIYRDDLAGRSYAAVDKVKKVSRERGFAIKTCFLADTADQADDENRLILCFRDLSMVVDAIYVTGQKAVNAKTVPVIAAIAKEARVPTFSQSGLEEVSSGLLLSISQAGFKYVADFYAKTIAKIFNGALPGKLNQIFEDPSKIAINLTPAETIKFYPSLDVLSSADEIFR